MIFTLTRLEDALPIDIERQRRRTRFLRAHLVSRGARGARPGYRDRSGKCLIQWAPWNSARSSFPETPHEKTKIVHCTRGANRKQVTLELPI